MAGRQDYEERKQARIDRLENAAEKARKGADEACQRSYNLTKDIPLGQPNIRGALTGTLNKSRQAMDKSCKLSDTAEYLESKLKATENNYAISSDDPNSIEKLQQRIDNLKEKQTFAKAINAYYRKNKTCKGFQDLTDEQSAKWDKEAKESFSWEQRPFPSYELTSINNKIKLAEKRIEEIKAVEEMTEELIEYDFCKIESNAETNRVTILFYEKQPDEIIQKLKYNGFKWAYSEGKWQRLRTPQAWRLTKRLINDLFFITKPQKD